MTRSEYAANEALATRAPQAAWMKPAPARRPAKPSLLARLIALFTA